MSLKRRFLQLDVFSRHPMKGNPLAVVVDGEGLDDATMRAFARWTNLSETTFLLPPTVAEADYRVRIFTPRQELPFAGHPSVGSAYAAIESGLVARDKTTLVQECAAGLLPVTADGAGADRTIHVQAPAARVKNVEAEVRQGITAAIGMPADALALGLVDIGPHWWVCDMREASRVRSVKPDLHAIAQLCETHGAIGLSVFGQEQAGPAHMAVRAFCPADGIPEDPVTGSANAAIMAFLLERSDATYGPDYLASQGREVQRDGYVRVRHDLASGAITIGGQCAMTIRGELELAAAGG